ncbi:MAG TPA: UDP-glucose/GDP-mannose dehydrogenase family protein [Bacillota bacterium]|nr:UDP-glucose/GDP-mannose dehydrogenase family protein [Bacillota bacterium]
MKIAVIGTGYVGVTTAASLGELSHEIMGVDIDKEKIRKLKLGTLPIYEPGLEPLLQQLLKDGALQFTTSIQEAVDFADIIFIAVGTPSLPNGEPNMTYVEQVAKEIGRTVRHDKIVVNKSTVPVGTADRVKELILHEMKAREIEANIDVVSNPEFLQEGKALQDAREPQRIVLGCSSEVATEKMLGVYAALEAPKIVTTPRNAEMIKYASNAFLATKISFMNELARLCDRLNVDITEVAKGMGLDQRIGDHFLKAGIGFGGSCFPKDVSALCSMGNQAHMEMSILQHVQEVNFTQPNWFVEQMSKIMNGLHGKKVALLGLSFKPETDDIREAPSLKLIPKFLELGAFVMAYDPIVNDKVKERFSEIIVTEDPYEAVSQSDAIVLCTEWRMFLEIDWRRVKELMEDNYLFDGRNVLNPKEMRKVGFSYWGVGRRL